MTERIPTEDGSQSGVRLAKRLMAEQGCSRSMAEQYIEGGWVRVDGVVIETPGARVQPTQRVELASDASPQQLTPVTLLLHKPAGLSEAQALALLSAATHWPGDTQAPRMLQRHWRYLECMIPLPAMASGLMVCTQDPRIARKLGQDWSLIEQECIADIAGTLTEEAIQKLSHGLQLDGRALPPIKVSRQSEQRLRFALKGIDPAQVPAMCAAVGLAATSLRRIRMGRVPLARLPEGQWRYLSGWERF